MKPPAKGKPPPDKLRISSIGTDRGWPDTPTVQNGSQSPVFVGVQIYPDVALELEANDRRIDIIQNGFDMAIRLGRLPGSTLRAKRLTGIRHILVASKKLLAGFGMPERPEDISRFPILQYWSTRQNKHWNFVRPDGSAGFVQIKKRIVSNNGDFLNSCAIDGLGVAMQPTFISSSAIVEGLLVPLFPDHFWSDDPADAADAAYAVYPEARVLPLRVRTLIDHIATAFSDEPWWDLKIRKHYRLHP